MGVFGFTTVNRLPEDFHPPRFTMLGMAAKRALMSMRPTMAPRRPIGMAAACAVRFMSGGANPKVFFDVDIGGKPAGRITFELFKDVVPKVPTGHHNAPPLLSSVQSSHQHLPLCR